MASNEQDDPVSASPKIAIVNGMVLVQRRQKIRNGIFGTVKVLAQRFNDRLTTLTARFNKIILDLVFNTYKPNSLKQKTRETLTGKSSCTVQDWRWQRHQTYPLTSFYHMKNKSRPDSLPCTSITQLQTDSPQLVIMPVSGQTRGNRDLHFEDNNHEEADTIMICLADKALQWCPNAELVFSFHIYHIVENFGGGKLWRVWRIVVEFAKV